MSTRNASGCSSQCRYWLNHHDPLLTRSLRCNINKALQQRFEVWLRSVICSV